MTTPRPPRKPPSRKSPGRPPKPGPHMERRSISLYPSEWAELDALPGKNRSEQIRYLLSLAKPR